MLLQSHDDHITSEINNVVIEELRYFAYAALEEMNISRASASIITNRKSIISKEIGGESLTSAPPDSFNTLRQ
jgi:hypothetical protein